MDLKIAERTALVLGAGGGLGGAIADALAREGARLVAADLDRDAAQRTVDRITEAGGRGRAVRWDLARTAEADNVVTEIEANEGGVDILVNNTGGPPPSPVHGQDLDLWARHFQSMVLSVIALTDRVLPGMKSRSWGRVITSTSSGVIAPIPNLGISNALRSTLVGWSKTLAGEVGAQGITSNIVLPGRIATPRITFLDQAKAEREGREVEDVTAESVSAIPLGRYGDPAEYGATVAFLAGMPAAYISGSVIRVDGGYVPSI